MLLQVLPQPLSFILGQLTPAIMGLRAGPGSHVEACTVVIRICGPVEYVGVGKTTWYFVLFHV